MPTNANNYKNNLTNPVNAQQPLLTGYPSQIRNNSAYSRGGKKSPKWREIKLSAVKAEATYPAAWSTKPLMSIPCSNCQTLGQLVSFWGILNGGSSGQVVPAAARAAPTIRHKTLFFSRPKIFLLSLLCFVYWLVNDLSHQLEALP